MTTINLVIASTVDDGTSHSSVGWNDSFISAGYLGSASRNYWGVVSFPGVTIPQGATIASATLTLYVTVLEGGAIVYSLIAQGQKIADAAVPDSANNPGAVGWTHTTANTTYVGTPTINADLAFDVTSIIQELVNQGAWASGNRVNLDLSNNGMSGGTDQRVDFYDRATGTAHPAALDITYGSVLVQPEQKVNLVSYVDEPYYIDPNYSPSLFAPSPGIFTRVLRSKVVTAIRVDDPNAGDDWLFSTGIIKGDIGSDFTPSITNAIRNRTISIGFGSG